MTTTTPWSDVPPSEAGEWWVRRRSDGATLRLTLLPDGYWITSPYMVKSGRVAEQFQFGPRVLTAEQTVELTAEVERLRQTLREYCDDDEVSSGFGSGCYSGRQIDEIRKRHGLDTESESA